MLTDISQGFMSPNINNKSKKRTFSPIMLLYENSQQRNPEKGQNRAQCGKSKKKFFEKRL